MKKTLIVILSFISYNLYAQEPLDALRNSWNVQGGSARVKAVGGAMGSLGGDITATFVNPAGLAFFKTGEIIASPNFLMQKTKATYNSRKEQEKMNQFTWGTTGFVIGSGNRRNKNVKNVAFSLAYNRTADFNSEVLYRGSNNQSSFSQKFVEELRNSGVRNASSIENEFVYGASLVYNTHWIDPVKNGSGQIVDFVTNAPITSGLLQQNRIKTSGGVNEFALGLATNVKDKLMFGASLGIPVFRYERETEFLEVDASENPNNQFDYGLFNERLKTTGAGINLKAGLIYKPEEFWRLGLAVHSPSFLSLTDKTEVAVVLNDDVADDMAWTDESNRYTEDGGAITSKYVIMTPYKVIGSVSYVLREIEDVTKQRGFLTADIEYVNHKASSFSEYTDENTVSDSENKAYYKALNKAIDKAYKGAFNVRVGGELKFTVVMVRLGAAYYGNPYKNINGEKGNKLNLSGGLGYRDKGFFVDLTYVHSIQKDVHFPYRLETAAYTAAKLKSNVGNALLTVGIKF
jgi:long-subunit fatty acid transport protein